MFDAIREIQEKDIDECVNVIRTSFQTVADEFGFTKENAPRYTAFATDAQRIRWQMLGEQRPMYAYFDEDSIVGYYSLALQDNNECELNNLCVLPAYRHKGIGEALLLHAFERAKELVTESYRIYRDGGEIFYKEYGIRPEDLFKAYHKRKPIEKIEPYENLLEKLQNQMLEKI